MKNLRIIMFIFFIWTRDLQSAASSNQSNAVVENVQLQQAVTNNDLTSFIRAIACDASEHKSLGSLTEVRLSHGQMSARKGFYTTSTFLTDYNRHPGMFSVQEITSARHMSQIIIVRGTLKKHDDWQNLTYKERRKKLTEYFPADIYQAVDRNFDEDN